MKLVVGLIGGIGSGKSRVGALFAERGARVISGDALGHEALRQPDIKARVVERWGQDVLTGAGEIDRRRLGARVFADTAELRALEALVFPYIGSRLQEEVAKAQADPEVRLVLVDAAVMLEAGWAAACDRLVYVHAPRAERLRRLAQRGWGAKEVEARERMQLPLTDKVSRADVALDNSGPAEETARQVDALLRQWGLAPLPAQGAALDNE
jgi:dephospho-CoA kinase